METCHQRTLPWPVVSVARMAATRPDERLPSPMQTRRTGWHLLRGPAGKGKAPTSETTRSGQPKSRCIKPLPARFCTTKTHIGHDAKPALGVGHAQQRKFSLLVLGHNGSSNSFL